jgi:hypothetical protein
MKIGIRYISVWLLLVFISKLIPSDSWAHLHSHAHTIHAPEHSHKLILDSEHHHCDDNLFFISPFVPVTFSDLVIKTELNSKETSNYRQFYLSKTNKFHTQRGPPYIIHLFVCC